MPFTVQETREISILVVMPEPHLKQVVRALRNWSFVNIKASECTDIIHNQNHQDVQVAIIHECLPAGETARELIRHVTMHNALPPWCKFIISASSPEPLLSSLPYRFLSTEVIDTPVNDDELDIALRHTLDALKSLQNVVSTLQQQDPRAILHAVKQAKTSAVEDKLQENLNLILVRMLFINGHVDKALEMVEQIGGNDGLNGMAFILYLIAENERLDALLSAQITGAAFQEKAFSYQILLDVNRHDLAAAEQTLTKLTKVSNDATTKQLQLVVEYCLHGLSRAQTLYNTLCAAADPQQSNNYPRQALDFAYKVINLLCLIDSDRKKEEVKLARGHLAEFIQQNKAGDRGFYYQKYSVFINLLLLALQENAPAEKLRTHLKELHAKTARHPNIVVQLLQAACAVVLGMRDITLTCLARVDGLVSALEPSPELINIEIVWQRVMQRLAGVDGDARWYGEVAKLLQARGLNYRAMRRVHYAVAQAPDNLDLKRLMAEIMVQLRRKEYQGVRLSELLNYLNEHGSSDQKSQVRQLQMRVEQTFA